MGGKPVDSMERTFYLTGQKEISIVNLSPIGYVKVLEVFRSYIIGIVCQYSIYHNTSYRYV